MTQQDSNDAPLDPIQLARLRWQCRRGMRELDVVVMRYLEQRYPTATPTQRRAFETVLEMQDPTILAYLTGQAAPDDKDVVDVIAELTRPGA